MPSIIEGLNWQRIMEAGASGFGSSVAEVVIKGMFPDSNNTEKLLSQAVGEICDRVKKVVDQAFINEYVADCNSIASRLAAYPDSRDVTILQSVFNEGSNLIYRLRNFDTFESIVTENYICTLHLMAVKALSEYKDEQHDYSGYKDTLKRLGREYADWCEPRSERLNDFARVSVSGVTHSPFFAKSDSEPYMISPKHSDSDIPKLSFAYVFYDLWHTGEDQSLHNYSLTFELTNPKWYYWEHFGMWSVTLNEEGKKAPEFIQASQKAYKEATDLRNDFLNDRLNITNAMKESVLSACKTWRKL
ncbi:MULTISPECIES: hypothetical protein [unclassified Bacillus cereus group]|uniref:hypothetical protein n=1 Tax=unclassified Bacillus cereus group TaxID=2750818 RepID=UPI0011EC7C31|nr:MULTISPECIES: hypothetical protein [unclassified Bacillus cereus group]QEL71765.1 hypothetical protein DN399_27390 [Bacillus sp. AR4-2]QEL77043.1 hypothetical protein DN405_27390 [Bacillus sp. SH8-8]